MNVSLHVHDQLLATKFFPPSTSHALITRLHLTGLLLRASFH